MSKFEEFLEEINTLPIELRRSLVLMRELDTKKDGKLLSQSFKCVLNMSVCRASKHEQQNSQIIFRVYQQKNLQR